MRIAISFLILLLTLGSDAAIGRTWVVGKDYFMVPESARRADEGHRGVVEVFSYACPHCAEFQPQAQTIRDSLSYGFSVRPVVFRPDWIVFARAYYAAKAAGVFEQSHDAFFGAARSMQYPSIEQIADWYAKNYSVDKGSFIRVASSHETTQAINADQAYARAHGIDRTPTLIVNGKYRVIVDESKGINAARAALIALDLSQQ